MALDVTLAVAAGVDVTTELPPVCVTCALVLVLDVLAAGPGVVLTVATPGDGVVLMACALVLDTYNCAAGVVPVAAVSELAVVDIDVGVVLGARFVV